MENTKLHDKIAREIEMTQLKAKDELRKVEKDIKEVIRGF